MRRAHRSSGKWKRAERLGHLERRRPRRVALAAQPELAARGVGELAGLGRRAS